MCEIAHRLHAIERCVDAWRNCLLLNAAYVHHYWYIAKSLVDCLAYKRQAHVTIATHAKGHS